MTIPTLPKGYERRWLKCRTCANVAYYDFVPYSFSNPIRTSPCGHGMGERDLGCDTITADEAVIFFSNKEQRK